MVKEQYKSTYEVNEGAEKEDQGRYPEEKVDTTLLD